MNVKNKKFMNKVNKENYIQKKEKKTNVKESWDTCRKCLKLDDMKIK